LAEQLAASPPNFEAFLNANNNGGGDQSNNTPVPPVQKTGNGGNGKRPVRKFNPANHQASLLASATLAKAAFLCHVLGEPSSSHHYLAFRIGFLGLEMQRPPASTKPLEVKLANQEQELANLLKRIPLNERMMQDIREKAKELRTMQRGEAL